MLKDLVRSGLGSTTGGGDQAVSSVTTEAVRDKLRLAGDLESLADVSCPSCASSVDPNAYVYCSRDDPAAAIGGGPGHCTVGTR